MKEKYKEPCEFDIKVCPSHRYHCAKCNTAILYYASRLQDIPYWCQHCDSFEEVKCNQKKYRCV